MSKLKLGIIGLSEGNGHPYSWSAICNGYDEHAMSVCEFPVIPRYLAERSWPEDRLQGAEVTHVWTEDRALSERIAAASHIPNVVDDYREMVGAIDGLLLARDDSLQHARFAEPFLRAGIPVYIDKPLAITRDDAAHLLSLRQFSGQIFSCSALRYAKELSLLPSEREQIGRIRHILATVPKDWDRYAIHALEPALLLIPDRGERIACRRTQIGFTSSLSVEFSGGQSLTIHAMGNLAAPIALSVMGESGWKQLVFRDSFSAFKVALETFVSVVQTRHSPIADDFLLEVADLLEAGR